MNTQEIEDLLSSNGGMKDQVSLPSTEVWRIRVGKAVFTMYSSGTLFSNPAKGSDLVDLRRKISDTLGVKPTSSSEFFLGLDETGKGEALGDTVLCGVVIPAKAISRIDEILGVADTKKRRTCEYWDRLFIEIDG